MSRICFFKNNEIKEYIQILQDAFCAGNLSENGIYMLEKGVRCLEYTDVHGLECSGHKAKRLEAL